MCGIVGWINLEENIMEKNNIIQAMVSKLSRRGPDDNGVYREKNVLLGHRRLVVVDPEGGRQPMTRQLGDKIYTIIYNGELYNTEELRKELKEKGHHFHAYSDTEVLLISYIEWGVDCVKKFNGIYAFGIWDSSKKALFMARDPLGVKPLFYTKIGNHFMFASEIKALLAHPLVEPVVGEEGLAEIFGLGPARSPGNGVYKNIYEVPPAYWLLYNDEGYKIKQYWQLESKEHEEDFDTTVEHVRSLIVDAIERQLVSDVPICTFLSGGVDSSAISSVAANAFRRDGKEQLNTYSIDYVDNALYFKANEYQPNSDGVYIQIMKNHIGSKHHNIVIDTPQLFKALEEAVKASDLPGMADIDSSLYLFCSEVRKKATVALSGECADEIFGGYPWFTRAEDISANTFPWAKSIKERKTIISKAFNHIDLESYVAAKYEETIKEVPRLDGESPKAHRMRELFYLNQKWFMITLLNRKDRMSMANSLEVRVPYADYRLVEYVWNVPWEMKYYNRQEKGLLRKALKGILPDEVLERKKSPYPKTHHPAYLKMVQQRMKSILQDRTSPLLDIIDIKRVMEIVETGGAAFGKPWFGQLMTGPQVLAYLIQVNAWMKEYNVKVIEN
ncbi:asparagine synthase (glutamine-hydrolyzing) [Clostridium formicaceticum]|uniref:asparagine synthase (glutamine-hydrolyzing) n=1 Tax=Clostridium formicaceticum TaxID=1497 RepID=A0AAC9WHU4_9CLOT|nr:asparagine synthase (glutamine-hydrolyzing) [Clostridium formicaceticum]AOY75052.1 asparagine synthase (glutamine-hydrolyzing) [Clostridium formicaceticum]ARE89472.1 Asparagine synthetase 3 [Clostridium formicaceticum]